MRRPIVFFPRAYGGLRPLFLAGALLLGPLFLVIAGCGAPTVSARAANGAFSISPATLSIDTNCTGCNAVDAKGAPVHRFVAKLAIDTPADVLWSISGGDAGAGAGSIDGTGSYRPPSFLTADQTSVEVTARLASDPSISVSAELNITPGFVQPLTPENAALGPGSSVTLTGRLAEAGGRAFIHFSLANTPTGNSGGLGTLSAANCQRNADSFTSCSVTYTAPATLTGTETTYVVATAAGGDAKTDAQILLNSSGVNSDPVSHQELQPTLMPLGSSGGNNEHFDSHGNSIVDCCGGTLGALVQDNTGKQFLLSNNHVLARSDQGHIGDAIVQPGLIDNDCTPNGEGPGTVPVATLSTWLPLNSTKTNADAALAQVAAHTVDPTGSILEFGPRQADGTLTTAAPGVSSSGGKGESAGLQMKVAKSGRTTGLTCASVSAVALDVSVDYYRDCAETKPYLSKVFTNQIAISGDRFSDAGDSGALVVDANNAEPIGLLFAGGTDTSGVGQAVASSASDVLSELASQAGAGTSYAFVGSADHTVSCLNYGDSTLASAQGRDLSQAQINAGQNALFAARSIVNPTAGILGVAMGKSSDQPDESAVVIYVGRGMAPPLPTSIHGVRTVVIPSTESAVANGSAPVANLGSASVPLPDAAIQHALQVKQKNAHTLMTQHAGIFGVGVGTSLDDPREAALVIYVDRNHIPAQLPAEIEGIRTRYVFMDRLHVTRSFLQSTGTTGHCAPRSGTEPDPGPLVRDRILQLP